MLIDYQVIQNVQMTLTFFREIESEMLKFDNLGFTFITGDLNCRTSNEYDFIIFDKYLDDFQPMITQVNDNNLQRNSKDTVIDAAGKILLQLCQATGFLIANGRLGTDDKVGEYTFCSSRGVSVVDYLLLKHEDFNLIHD